MEALFHLVFTLLKVSVQAWLYSWLLFLLARWYGTHHPDGIMARATRQAGHFRRRCWPVFAVALLLFSFTYWGNHGLGDYARIPLGHGEEIQEINGMFAYFEASRPFQWPTDQPYLSRYQLADDVLCGQASDTTFYFTYDLKTKVYRTFNGAASYNAHARAVVLPSAGQFERFHQHYARYWGGWRFWLLA